jgi:hypothetical protein
MFVAAERIGAGLVASLARPGDNLTAFSILSSEPTPNGLSCCQSWFLRPE